MKLYVDTTGKQVTVSKDSEPKQDQNGTQKSEKGTGRLMWSTQVFVLDENGGEVITITTAGEKPNVKVGQPVTVSRSGGHSVGDQRAQRRRVPGTRTASRHGFGRHQVVQGSRC